MHNPTPFCAPSAPAPTHVDVDVAAHVLYTTAGRKRRAVRHHHDQSKISLPPSPTRNGGSLTHAHSQVRTPYMCGPCTKAPERGWPATTHATPRQQRKRKRGRPHSDRSLAKLVHTQPMPPLPSLGPLQGPRPTREAITTTKAPRRCCAHKQEVGIEAGGRVVSHLALQVWAGGAARGGQGARILIAQPVHIANTRTRQGQGCVPSPPRSPRGAQASARSVLTGSPSPSRSRR